MLQGRLLNEAALAEVRALLARQPPLSRRQLSLHLCAQWNWRTAAGQLKDMAARSLLRKLQQKGLIQLPPVRHLPWAARPGLSRPQIQELALEFSSPDSIHCPLGLLSPITVQLVQEKSDRRRLGHLLQNHHYLGWSRPVGESLAYWAHDRHGRLLALALWGAAAWKAAARDRWIGWTDAARTAGLKFLANNQRLLLLPWVRVPHLGSHFLGQMQRRIRADWQQKYHHDLYLLESFVQQDRFPGTLYRAANWSCVGQTQGRSRQDRFHRLDLPRKSIWLLALQEPFPQALYEAIEHPSSLDRPVERGLCPKPQY
jgi:hypothetical protein